jgi:hypothetical protein
MKMSKWNVKTMQFKSTTKSVRIVFKTMRLKECTVIQQQVDGAKTYLT